MHVSTYVASLLPRDCSYTQKVCTKNVNKHFFGQEVDYILSILLYFIYNSVIFKRQTFILSITTQSASGSANLRENGIKMFCVRQDFEQRTHHTALCQLKGTSLFTFHSFQMVFGGFLVWIGIDHCKDTNWLLQFSRVYYTG